MSRATDTVNAYLKRLKSRRAWHTKLAAVMVCLSLVVGCSTTWALHLEGEGKTIDASTAVSAAARAELTAASDVEGAEGTDAAGDAGDGAEGAAGDEAADVEARGDDVGTAGATDTAGGVVATDAATAPDAMTADATATDTLDEGGELGLYALTNTVEGVSPASTRINLFDYYVSSWDGENDGSDLDDDGNVKGINYDHYLRFSAGTRSVAASAGSANGWTASGAGVLQGIVASSLGNDGYPYLNGAENPTVGGTYVLPVVTGYSNTESLDYLFDPNYTGASAVYRHTYTDVQNLLQIDEQGYYYYDSTKNYAAYDEGTNSFTLYADYAVVNGSDVAGTNNGQFFPFDSGTEVSQNTTSSSESLDHFFGMTMTTRFIQRYNGYTNSNKDTATTFEFAGDDDVWIFIDGTLVADLGGIHQSRSVSINYVEGTVEIDGVLTDTGTAIEQTTYFRDLFGSDQLQKNGDYTTFKDNSTHVLQFYFLERGGNASNLNLKYNLTEIPDTSIFKVDQYGNNVSGATFAFYPAYVTGESTTSETWYYATSKEAADSETGGVAASVLNASEFTYTDSDSDKPWSIVYNSSGTETIIPALYYGKTDENGSMTFVDRSGMPLSLSEIQSLLGDHFILREVEVPNGYRAVSDEAFLSIAHDTTILTSDPYSTGVWVSPNAQVTATNKLYVAESSEALAKSLVNQNTPHIVGNDTDGYTIDYYDVTEEAHGTLFAVVLKRNDADDGAIDINDLHPSTWYPLYGSDDDGYVVADTFDMDTVIAVAKKQQEYANNVFEARASGMQLTLTDLPGDPTRYYTYALTNDLEVNNTEPQYEVAYYWTTEDIAENGWKDVSANNTVRVASHAATTAATADFEILWGGTIEVPNVINALYFQKADESVSMLIDDAVFALYEVATAANSASHELGYYKATDASGSGAYVRLDEDADGNAATGKATVYTTLGGTGAEGTYSIRADNLTIPTTGGTGLILDADAGVITVTVGDAADGTAGSTTYTITPAQNALEESLVGYTHDVCAGVSEDGTGHFHYLKSGDYFLKEIAAPAGYTLNSENVMVAVNQNGVYASAGDEKNGVRVGNGPGYLVKTLDTFASLGHIDETLSWIYGVLKVDDEHDVCFEGVNNLENEAHLGVHDISYPLLSTNVTIGGENSLTENGDPYNNTTAMVTYQQYDGSANAEGPGDDSIFDYVVVNNETHNSETVKGVAGTETLRLWTESGWSDLAIYQDYTYGHSQTNQNTAYTNLSEYGDIANLFSSSTFVQVSDTVNIDLTVTKVTDDFYADAETENTTTVYLDDAEFTLARYVDGSGNIVTKDTEGATVQYYDPAIDDWVNESGDPPKLTSTTTFTDGTSMEYTVTSQVYAYQDDITHHLIYTKVFIINGQTYRLESITNGTATLKPVTVTRDETTGKTTVTDDTSKSNLTGTLARSFFKVRGLSQGTYYLTETKNPSYTTSSDSVDFQSVGETVITISDGTYYYYEKDGDKIIVTNLDDIGTDPTTKELYIEVTEGENTVRYPVYEGNSFSVSIDGDDASYLVELDDSGTTAPYYEDVTGTVQMGFRVNNTSQTSSADIQLVKVDATNDPIGDDYPGGEVGYLDNLKYFLVSKHDGDPDDPFTDNETAHLVLTGAEFKLYRLSEEEGSDGTQTKLYYKLNADGTAEVTGNEAEATVLKVDEKGYLKITGLNTAYTYYLVETKAPDGYALPTEAVKISWSNGTLTVNNISATIQNVGDQQQSKTAPKGDYIVIYNWTGYELPKTGGAGTLVITLGGLALIAASLVYGYKLKRSRAKGVR